MSAQPCGCDLEERYTCEECRKRQRMPYQHDAWQAVLAQKSKSAMDLGLSAPFNVPPSTPTLREDRSVSIETTEPHSTLTEDLDAYDAKFREDLRHYNECIVISINNEVARRLAHVAAILRTFHGAQISMSSIQPILDLSVELNPDLKKPAYPEWDDNAYKARIAKETK